MNEKELKRMTRSELLELLLIETEENRILKARLQRTEQLLSEKMIAIENAGSIAEASLKLNGVFEAAEKAAAQYLENIKLMSERTSSIYQSEEEEAKRKARAIVAEALAYRQKVYAEAKPRRVAPQSKGAVIYRARRVPEPMTQKPFRKDDSNE